MTVAARWLAVAVVAAGLLAGCDNMANQAKRNAYSPPVQNGLGIARVPPEGTVPRHDAAADVPAPPVTMALLERGRERFNIYCSPCHARDGYGDGMIVQRGFPHPPSYHIDRLREAPAQHFYDVITNGYGVMYSYATRVDPEDRWAIAAYIRALQASQHASLADLPPDERRKLQAQR